eukprot:200781_1
MDSTMNEKVRNATSITYLWIGYHDTQNEGVWKWIGYNQSSFASWSSNEPNNAGDGEDCCIMTKLGNWNDLPCNQTFFFVCGEPGDYPTKHPTNDPTTTPTLMPSLPTANPTVFPSETPTAIPTELPTRFSDLNGMKTIDDGSFCDNLADNYDLIYDINLNQCTHLCRSMRESCRMINFYYYFKSQNDSRCYVFDDVCDVVSKNKKSTNQTTMYYKTYDDSCVDYPRDWRDNIGDDCATYSTYNWCENGEILRDENAFDELSDTRYNLAAVDACCECGGGIDIMNNVAFGVDQNWKDHTEDMLCSFTPQYFEETTTSVRQWDNLVLYELCDYLSEINCAFLVDSQFHSNQYSYSIHLCSGSKA